MDNFSGIVDKINTKYTTINQKTETHLEGLLWSKPITYWDYIHTDALLNLQIQRTTLPDENIFIMYHQINELLFKMVLWEINQIAHATTITTPFFTERLLRISRYFDMLTNSFVIMGDGMDKDQYLKFRQTLTPASGFQSAQYRKIEFCSTNSINLVDHRYKQKITQDMPMDQIFEHLYWQAAGKDYQTGQKLYFLEQFEKKYKTEFLDCMQEYKDINLWQKFKQLPQADQQDAALIEAMRHYDYTVNITWVMGHYNAAKKYIDNGEATGGSDWKKYMHPKYQKRIFFPELWTAQELSDWGQKQE